MERKDRPLSRKKNVSEGTAHVGRREGSGPLSGQQAPGDQSQRSGQQRASGGQSPLLRLIILAAVLLLGGGGGLSALLGGGQTADPSALPTQAVVSSTPRPTGGSVDTAVSGQARDKRVVLKGDNTDTTTILVYMCGTDLESGGGYATKDLQEMAAAKLSDKVKLLVFTGGCKSWKNSVVSASKNQIFQVMDGGLALLWENSSLQSMTSPDTLASFIQWGVKNAPADRYELIFWDHGGGSVSGYGYDEVYARTGSMTLDGIADALKKGGCTFDFVGFDACLMATLETALVVEPYADYLIASEETEPGCGWYYTDWLNALSKTPSLSALNIGRQIADDFVSVCGQAAPRQQATLSVIDLAELAGTVPSAFQRFAQSTADSIKSDDYQRISAARGSTKEFAESSNIDQVDLIHLSDNLDTAESRTLAQVLRSAVKYNATSSNIRNANGVSIYFPYGRSSNVSKMAAIYGNIGLDPSYTECIKSFASLEVAGQTVSGGSASQLNSLFGALLGDGAANVSSQSVSSAAVEQLLSALLSGSGRSLANVGLSPEEADFLDADLLARSAPYLAQNQFDTSALTWTRRGAGRVLDLTEDQWALVQDVELNVFVDDGAGYIDLGLDNVFDLDSEGDLIGDYDGTWLAVNGQIVAYYMLETQGDDQDYRILGRIPALLNGRRVELMVSFTDEVPDGEVLGAAVCYDADAETATVARGLLDIQENDVIDFLCDYYDYDRNYQDAYLLGESLTVRGPLELTNIRMDNDSYIAAFRITDIYHNHFWTPSL